MKDLMRPSADEWGIRKLQNCILHIAAYIDELCQQHGISYCLMGGSALGAVRHGGFIPWDDDMDIFMRPEEYARFRDAFRREGDHAQFYLHEQGEKDGRITSAKLRYNQSYYIEDNLRGWDIHQGVFVDIFILHTCPENKWQRAWQYAWNKYLVVKGAANRRNYKPGLEGLAVRLAALFPRRFLLGRALKEIYRYDGASSSLCCHFIGHARMKAGLYRSAYFEGTRRVPFETITLAVPACVEDYLRDRWGDYMQLPPRESIKRAQHCTEWNVEKAMGGHTAYNNYTDEPYLF